ncbi:MAG: ATP-binding protein [Lachnospiraceae bacterium]|nr:ATP-binding protein [Lachnospiraceae bacterium]
MNRKKIPIGVDDFTDFKQQGFYFVDKTGLIKELLGNGGKVNLFARPRRFGKSLNMSMLKCFFEIGTDKSLFDGLEISSEEKLCEEYMGQYPVISLSLKTVHAESQEMAMYELGALIGKEAMRFHFLLDDDRLSKEEKKLYSQLIRVSNKANGMFDLPETVITGSLNTLSMLLHKYYEHKVIILIDEYDVPLAKANERGYYRKMVDIIRNMFDAGLKSNPHLEFAVLTGCLRVSKESIFTGLNNPKIYSMLSGECSRWFGFTDAEVRDMLAYYGLSEYYDVTKEWYDGYRIGEANVYNPWDVINWCSQLLNSPDKSPKLYWANSSGNEELKRFVRRMGNGVMKAELERLLSGQSVQKQIEEQLTYDTIYDSIENMWSLLYATGYLTADGLPVGDTLRLRIPNLEVSYIFSRFILGMFQEKVAGDGQTVANLCSALKAGDAPEVERLFAGYLSKTVTIRDTAVPDDFKEQLYHGAMLGILAFKENWGVTSNGQSGDGYYDILIEDEEDGIGIVIETKYAKKEQYDAACKKALKQINEKNYTAELREDDMHTIFKYGIACYRNRCRVVVEREENL